MILERVLRAAAIIIAILGLVDPVMTLPWREPTVVSVAVVDPVADEMSPLAQGALSRARCGCVEGARDRGAGR